MGQAVAMLIEDKPLEEVARAFGREKKKVQRAEVDTSTIDEVSPATPAQPATRARAR